MYSTVAELMRVLTIRVPTAEQLAAGEVVLNAASLEVDSEIDFVEGAPALEGDALDLATEVTLERAVEHWQQRESPFGLMPFGAEGFAERIPRDSWWRHAAKLAPLKQQWPVA